MMDKDSHPPSKTVCKSDSGPAPSQNGSTPTFPSDKIYAEGHDLDQNQVIDGNSESIDHTEEVSEPEPRVEEGSYAQYHGHVHVQHHEFAHVRHEYHEHHREFHGQRHVSPRDPNPQERNYESPREITELDDEANQETRMPDRDTENIVSNGDYPRHSAITTNSFDQVADEIAEDLEVFQQVEEQELHNLAELIPERNQDRLFSEVDPPAQPLPNEEPIDVHSTQSVQDAGEEEHPHEEQPMEEHLEELVQFDASTAGDLDAQNGHHGHEENYQSNSHQHHHGYEEQEYTTQEQAQYDSHEHPMPSEDCGCDEVTVGTLPAGGVAAMEDQLVHDDPVEHGAADAVETAEVAVESAREENPQAECMSHHSDLLSQDDESEATLPGPPPSFGYRGERLSHNVADAMALIWDKFWSEDVREIIRIIKNRFSQIMPYVRRFMAHLAAFWGGITYIRRAIAAFIRLLKRDARVRELLERVGWASATTLRVFLSMCAMIMQASLQFYHLMRDRIIPDTRRVIPILFYKAVMKLLALSYHSPWSLVLGPFSLTFAIDGDKLPDRYYLHDKLGVPQDDVTFASLHDLVTTVRQSVYRSRHPHAQPSPEGEIHDPNNMEEDNLYDGAADAYGTVEFHEHDEPGPQTEPAHENDILDEMHENNEPSEMGSTPVHTQTTDEVPVPPPLGYCGPKYPGSKTRVLQSRHSNGPLSERTNIDDGEM